MGFLILGERITLPVIAIVCRGRFGEKKLGEKCKSAPCDQVFFLLTHRLDFPTLAKFAVCMRKQELSTSPLIGQLANIVDKNLEDADDPA